MTIKVDFEEECKRVKNGEPVEEVLADLIEALCDGNYGILWSSDFVPCSRDVIEKAMSLCGCTKTCGNYMGKTSKYYDEYEFTEDPSDIDRMYGVEEAFIYIHGDTSDNSFRMMLKDV